MGKTRNNNWSDEKRQRQAEICRKTGQSNKGQPCTAEHRKKISESMKKTCELKRIKRLKDVVAETQTDM